MVKGQGHLLLEKKKQVYGEKQLECQKELLSKGTSITFQILQ